MRFTVFYLVSLIVLIIIFSISFGNTIEMLPFYTNIFHTGNLNLNTDKDEYVAGEKIKLELNLQNLEGVVIPDTYIIIEIVKGCDNLYSVEEINCDIIYEKVIYLGHFMPLEERNLTIDINTLEHWSSDIYRIDVYWKSIVAPIVGTPTSFFNPGYKIIKIKGFSELFPKATILSTKTRTAGGLSQRGPLVHENSKFIPIDLYIYSKSEFKGKIIYKTCEFDDTLCELGYKRYVLIEEYPIECKSTECKFTHYIQFGKNKTAYSVRMELYDESGVLNSLYRGRYVVSGEGAKIIKLGLKDVKIRSNEDFWVRMSLTGPLEPNRINTRIENVRLTFSIINDDKEVYKYNDLLYELELNQIKAYEIKFIPNFSLDNFSFCINLEKDNNVLDSYCSKDFVYKESKGYSYPDFPNTLLFIVLSIFLFVMVFTIYFRNIKK